jgi:hypothetical protein
MDAQVTDKRQSLYCTEVPNQEIRAKGISLHALESNLATILFTYTTSIALGDISWSISSSILFYLSVTNFPRILLRMDYCWCCFWHTRKGKVTKILTPLGRGLLPSHPDPVDNVSRQLIAGSLLHLLFQWAQIDICWLHDHPKWFIFGVETVDRTIEELDACFESKFPPKSVLETNEDCEGWE